MPRLYVILPLALAAFVFAVRPADAFPQFMKGFVTKYVDEAETEDEDFSKLIKKEAKCLVCHQGKKSKKNMNKYGKLLGELLGKADKKDKEKIASALEEVGEKHIDEEDEESATYAERIAEGKLPAGELDDLKEEPGDSE